MTSFVDGIFNWKPSVKALKSIGRLLVFVADHSNIMMMLNSAVFIENTAILLADERTVLQRGAGQLITYNVD